MRDIYFYYPNQPFFELVNFYRAKMIIDGKEYDTVEHYFQAMKATTEEDHEKVRTASTPGKARAIGKFEIKLRSDWENVKDDVMYKALYEKFTQHQGLKRVLLSTGDTRLHEASPHDKYWGVKGKDMLGKLLMKLRDELDDRN